MTLSSVLSNRGFTPLPTYINPVNVGRFSGRGLSIPNVAFRTAIHPRPAMIRKPVCIGSWRSSWPLRPAEVEELRTGEWVPEPEAA